VELAVAVSRLKGRSVALGVRVALGVVEIFGVRLGVKVGGGVIAIFNFLIIASASTLDGSKLSAFSRSGGI
jgi:hypothetical protein